MKKDIGNRADIELLVNTFYEKVISDKQLGFIFQEIAKVNWSTHLPAMYNFWENIILCTGTYEGICNTYSARRLRRIGFLSIIKLC